MKNFDEESLYLTSHYGMKRRRHFCLWDLFLFFCGICFCFLWDLFSFLFVSFFVVCLPNEREIPQLQPENEEFSCC